MNTTTNPVHDNRIFAPEARIFSPSRIFAPEARIFAPEARIFSPASTSCSSSPARLAGHAPGPARPGVGWLRRP
jgi:hypothetical protein